MRSINRVVLLVIAVAVIVVGLFHAFPMNNGRVKVRVSTTTSLHVSGLLEFLAKEFRRHYPEVELVFIAVGSGAALEYARRGDACAVLVHAPGLEKKYAELNAVKNQRIFAYNVFVVVGPEGDPANISKATSIRQAFERIYAAAKKGETVFVSRGDGSGTHAREASIWRSINVSTDGSWYRECGCSGDQALIIANELKAYTLTDVVTYTLFKMRGRIQSIRALYINHSDPLAINIYSAYVSDSCNDAEERRYAEAFVEFVYQNQHLIEKFNEALGFEGFHPARDREQLLSRIWEELAEVEVVG